MIVQVRVDDRLIHGQVALVWTKELNTTRIIVANKHAVESDALRMTLSMGTPAGQKLLVKDCVRRGSGKDRRGQGQRAADGRPGQRRRGGHERSQQHEV